MVDPDSRPVFLANFNGPLPQAVLTPKEKVGENPPDNDDAPIRNWDYTERREARQTAGNERGFNSTGTRTPSSAICVIRLRIQTAGNADALVRNSRRSLALESGEASV